MGTILLTGCSSSNQEPKQDTFDYTVEQFADLQLLRYKVHGFDELPLEQKKLVYYLSEAALQGRDILFDQNGKYNLMIRKLLETVYTDYKGDRTDANFLAMETYLKRVWFSNGIHHHYAADKFVPGFSPEFFKKALESVDASKLPLAEGETLESLCKEVFPVIFDAKIMAKRVNQADTYEGWSYKQNSFTSSGGTITLDAKLTKLLVMNIPFTITLSCDKDGNISYT